ncbi:MULTISPECIES: WavE lipopolysaccharide synthesis family protein [Paraburkholderia]|uniref:WavE lipopolysaccharide synthesis n=1 Tax=Paraburkholderia podalyriae TaxID=1938811 RepID=A0ABR7PYT6_9BURK|nr:WavE lipopolysaccharide synthesis family protein [Paraburkholderia podalyriae]MBC8751445.1 hypothetical protein [Paraburkholderia podalyriae]
MSIKSSDISIVIQGPIDWSVEKESLEGLTLAATRKIRGIFRDAEIIVSTWEGERYAGLVYDKIVLSPLPPAQGGAPSFTPNNVNRQIVGTRAGLSLVTRPFCLKIRSDMILDGDAFVRIFEERCKNPLSDERDVFEYPLVCNNFSSRNSASILERIPDHPLPFHPSDHFQFGWTDDVKVLWDIQLQSDEEGWYFLERAHPNRWRLHELSQYAPEQFIFLSAIRKKHSVDVHHYADDRPEVVALSDYYMNSHFVTVPDLLVPVRFPKYHTDHHFSFEWMRLNSLGITKVPSVVPSTVSRILSDIAYPFLHPIGFYKWLKKKVRRLGWI